MNVIRIRIWIDGQENFIREVEIKFNQYFKDLYDFLQMHTFKLEVVDITGVDDSIKYPFMAVSFGALQLQEKLEVEDDAEKLKKELLAEFNALNGEDDDNDFDLDDDL